MNDLMPTMTLLDLWYLQRGDTTWALQWLPRHFVLPEECFASLDLQMSLRARQLTEHTHHPPGTRHMLMYTYEPYRLEIQFDGVPAAARVTMFGDR